MDNELKKQLEEDWEHLKSVVANKNIKGLNSPLSDVEDTLTELGFDID